jgi:hypothetical protein
MGGVDVVLPFRITGDRGDLVSLDDQLSFQLLNGFPRLLGGALVRIANRN